MMNTGYWAGEAIAESIARANDAARHADTVKHMATARAGDVALGRAALRELQRLDPGNPLLLGPVQARVDALARQTYRRGLWPAVNALQVNLAAVLADVTSEFENERAKAIKKATADTVKPIRKGWFFINRRTLYAWRKTEYVTEKEADAAKQAELDRLHTARLGDRL